MGLLAAEPGHDVVAEACPRFAQRRDLMFEVVDLELDTVPTASLRFASIRHRLGGAARVGPSKTQTANSAGRSGCRSIISCSRRRPLLRRRPAMRRSQRLVPATRQVIRPFVQGSALFRVVTVFVIHGTGDRALCHADVI